MAEGMDSILPAVFPRTRHIDRSFVDVSTTRGDEKECIQMLLIPSNTILSGYVFLIHLYLTYFTLLLIILFYFFHLIKGKDGYCKIIRLHFRCYPWQTKHLMNYPQYFVVTAVAGDFGVFHCALLVFDDDIRNLYILK